MVGTPFKRVLIAWIKSHRIRCFADLPLAISFDENLKMLIKMVNSHLAENILSESYAIIETVL